MHECVVFSRGGDCGGGRGQKLVQFLVRFNRSGWFEVVFYVAVARRRGNDRWSRCELVRDWYSLVDRIRLSG